MNPPNLQSGPPRERLAWVDLFRGAAVLMMIETHVVNTFLAAALRETAWFAWLNYVNGLVAPSFLFIAGYMQSRSVGSGRRVPLARKAKRLLGIAALGFALQIPVHQIFARDWPEALRLGSVVNILPCLALALLILVAAQRLTQSWPAAAWGGVVTALVSVSVNLTPAAQSWRGPVALTAWVNGSTGSYFPVFPWLAFAFAGGLAGAFLKTPRAFNACAFLAANLIWATRDLPFSATSAVFFFQRLASVLALAAVSGLVPAWASPRLVLFAGRESLWWYAVHLGLISALSLAGLPGVSFGIAATMALIIVVVSATFFLVKMKTVLLPPRAGVERVAKGVAEKV